MELLKYLAFRAADFEKLKGLLIAARELRNSVGQHPESSILHLKLDGGGIRESQRTVLGFLAILVGAFGFNSDTNDPEELHALIRYFTSVAEKGGSLPYALFCLNYLKEVFKKRQLDRKQLSFILPHLAGFIVTRGISIQPAFILPDMIQTTLSNLIALLLDPETVSILDPHQLELVKSKKPLEFIPEGYLYHARDGADKVISRMRLDGEIPLTRFPVGKFSLWQPIPSLFGSPEVKAPAVFLIKPEAFNQLLPSGQATLDVATGTQPVE